MSLVLSIGVSPLLATVACMLFDVRCPGCSRPYPRWRNPVCPRCVEGFGSVVPVAVAGADDGFAGGWYESAVRRIVLAGKSGRFCVFTQLADVLGTAVEYRGWQVDIITWIPASNKNIVRRGYDQGQILAEGLTHRLGVPNRSLLRRVGRSGQTGMTRTERQVGPVLRAKKPTEGTVLLVDDVITTGVSMAKGTRLLRSSGARSIVTLAAASKH